MRFALCLLLLFPLSLESAAQTSSNPKQDPSLTAPDGCGSEAIARTEAPTRSLRGQYSTDTVSFSVKFEDEVSPYRFMSLFTLPGQIVRLEAVFGNRQSQFQACVQGGELKSVGSSGRWTWKAPTEPGLYRIYITDTWAEETMRLNAFVMVPYEGTQSLEGYRIGNYQKQPLYENPAYNIPRGMVRVTEDMEEIWLSPHFQLRQFLCKQSSPFPKFVIVGERLLLKLEWLLEEVNERGLKASSFSILSAFRTPFYNASIGNRTIYSRHTYGDAADIFIDEDGDGRMDDLNGDGRVDRKDASVLADVVESSFDDAWYQPFVGGLGLYGPKPHRGPFIHIDTRGLKARW